MKAIPKKENVIIILNIVGTGRQAGSLCCLNLEFFIFSYSKSSSEIGSLFIWEFLLSFSFPVSAKFVLLEVSFGEVSTIFLLF